jgi:hypothetical protein
MNLDFKSSSSSRREVDRRSLHPFIHRWSNQRSKPFTFRPASSLDVAPPPLDMLHLTGRDFFDVFFVVGFVILLFIDTSPNAFALT